MTEFELFGHLTVVFDKFNSQTFNEVVIFIITDVSLIGADLKCIIMSELLRLADTCLLSSAADQHFNTSIKCLKNHKTSLKLKAGIRHPG